MSSTIGFRKAVGVCFVLLYLAVGVPLWYKLTNIYRAPLPSQYIESLHDNVFQDVHMVIPVYLKSDLYKFPDLHDAVQVQVNHLLNTREHDVAWSLQVLQYDEKLMKGLEEAGDDVYMVDLVLDESCGFVPGFGTKHVTVLYDDESVATNDLPFFVAQTLVEHVFGMEWDVFSNYWNRTQNSVAVLYKPDIHISISLLNGGSQPVSWEIDEVLKEYFTPFRQFITSLVNFTVDTSIIYHNDLNLHSLNNSAEVSVRDLSHHIDLSDLSAMNDFKESSSVNLAIVYPDPEVSPNGLNYIQGHERADDVLHPWNSFIVPQWGVVAINKYPLKKHSVISKEYLKPIVYQFANDMAKLLGLVDINDDFNTPYITVESFKRVMILNNIEKSVETLWSLVKLSKQFQQMSIPKEVMGNVTEALDLRLEIVDLLNNPEKGTDLDWSYALSMSNKLVALTECAFFHGEMVQQNFFPQEHKVAVYLPLLGPLTIVIFLGAVSLFKEVPSTDKTDEDSDEKDVNIDSETEGPELTNEKAEMKHD